MNREKLYQTPKRKDENIKKEFFKNVQSIKLENLKNGQISRFSQTTKIEGRSQQSKRTHNKVIKTVIKSHLA